MTKKLKYLAATFLLMFYKTVGIRNLPNNKNSYLSALL